ncbi:hypothetical protein ACFO4E_27470 [Nocardiopsis mangrovi]|uniref:Uncharacterized protein n=1 Tax=Nocardiopsis mangrovi TaxID=1179818 RepID=A0ABV9E350_9ACTN
MDSPVRWEPRIYPGRMEWVRRVRSDIRSDLGGFPDDLASDVELCASELYANAGAP